MPSESRKHGESLIVGGSNSLEGNTVTMHNALVRAAHRLTLNEKRLVSLALSKEDPLEPGLTYLESQSLQVALNKAKTGDQNAMAEICAMVIPTRRITAQEFAETHDVDLSESYRALREAATQLRTRSIGFTETRTKKNGTSVVVRQDMAWVGQCNYIDDDGAVELMWWPPVLQFLKGLKGNFTTYKLARASKLRSTYSWRLLELLKSHQYEKQPTTEWVVEIEELARMLDAPESCRDNVGNLLRFCVKPAALELIQKDEWKIEIERLKRGRRIVGLKFRYWRDPQKTLDLR